MTRDQFVDAVSTLIRTNDQSGVGIKASTLGNLILRSLPGHWQQHGFRQLKDLLGELEKRGNVQVVEAGPGIWMVSAKSQTPTELVAPAAGRSTQPRRLRKQVWAALVNTLPRGKRFLDRDSGDVLMGQAEAPSSGWIEIKPIPDETQKAWLRELSELAELPEVQDVLSATTWFALLPDVLRRVRPDLLAQWNVLRSARVAEYAKKWCEQTHVEYALVFNGQKTATENRPPVQDDVVRRQVLDALQRMTTDELLSIPIPGKYLLGDVTRTPK